MHMGDKKRAALEATIKEAHEAALQAQIAELAIRCQRAEVINQWFLAAAQLVLKESTDTTLDGLRKVVAAAESES